MIYGSSDVKHKGQKFLSFWTIFCPFTPEDIIILHMRALNDNHLMYAYRDMERYGQTFLLFWTIFWPFTALTTRKIKILKK